MRLGETLVSKGMITEQQLSEALHAQMIYGGHLGTCLIEMDSLDESTLGAVLAEVNGLKWAQPDRFHNIPLSVIEIVPRALAERLQVVPLSRKDRTIEVALVDPKNLTAQDEITFASGYTIEPWIAPEARIFQALERYYNVPQRQRYLTLCRQLDGLGDALDFVPASEWTNPDSLPLSPFVAPPEEAPKKKVTEQLVAAGEIPDLDELVEQLSESTTEGQVVDYSLDALRKGPRRSILFSVKSSVAQIWGSRGVERDLDPLCGGGFPVISEPLFGLLLGNKYYRGPLPEDRRFGSFHDKLRLSKPNEILLVPIHVQDRLIALLYADSGAAKRIPGPSEVYCRLAAKLGTALHMVRLREKVCTL